MSMLAIQLIYVGNLPSPAAGLHQSVASYLVEFLTGLAAPDWQASSDGPPRPTIERPDHPGETGSTPTNKTHQHVSG